MKLDLDAAQEGADREDRDAARPRSDRSGRRHPPHRHHQDGACGALGDHRARPRRRRLRARRLWRRRAAARLRGGARTADRARSSSRARRGISRPTACWSRICAAISSTPGSRRSPTRRFRRWKTIFAEMERQGRATVGARPDARRASRSSAPPTCAMSARSTPSRSSCRSSCSQRRTATASRSCSMPCIRRATAFRSPTEKAEIVSLRSAVIGEMRKPPFEHIAKGGAEPDAGGVPRQAPGVFRQRRASSTRRPTTAPRSRPATGSPARR